MSKKDKEGKIIETLSHCVSFGDPREYYNNLVQIREETEDNKEYEFLSEILKALSSRDRLLIIDMLRQKDRCVCELEVLLDKSQGAVSRQLKILEDSKLIKGWKQGKFTHYSLIRPVFEKVLHLLNKWTEKITNWFGEFPTIYEL
ncbi:MAG: winged helix-turn-helix transcriptional regulator [Candidatus Helarchaeota archaeon]|nr:winged helix-turn-helix transcriptional regulator [Candidatus Helarchaeota archaeon]